MPFLKEAWEDFIANILMEKLSYVRRIHFLRLES